MIKILRSHLGEPNATTLFNEPGNAKQMPTETALEIETALIRMMSLWQKILSVFNENNPGVYDTKSLGIVRVYKLQEWENRVLTGTGTKKTPHEQRRHCCGYDENYSCCYSGCHTNNIILYYSILILTKQ